MSETINRDAEDTIKGFRFQRLRALSALVKVFNKYDPSRDVSECEVHVSLEAGADVTVLDNKGNWIHEEDKCYDASSNFTFASDAILNTLVGFFDTYCESRYSENCLFVFCTTRLYGKERNSATTKNLVIELPAEKPILELIEERSYEHDETFLDTIKKFVVAEYEAQYPEDGKLKGNREIIKKFSNTQWIKFLNQVSWCFGVGNLEKLENEVLDVIKQSVFFSEILLGKEKVIKVAVLDLLEQKQAQKDFVVKKFTLTKFKLLLREIQAGSHLGADPTHELWDGIKIDDSRNITEKLTSVCDGFTAEELKVYCRKTMQGYTEIREFQDEKMMKSFLYNIFDVCQTELVQLIKDSNVKKMAESEIESKIIELISLSNERLNERRQTYSATELNRDTTRCLIYYLFDNCYIAFNKGN